MKLREKTMCILLHVKKMTPQKLPIILKNKNKNSIKTTNYLSISTKIHESFRY